jgi:hypothetical protein
MLLSPIADGCLNGGKGGDGGGVGPKDSRTQTDGHHERLPEQHGAVVG